MVNKRKYSKLNVCIITTPIQSENSSYFTIINNFLRILSPTVDKIFLITHNYPDNPLYLSKTTLLEINDSFFSRENILIKSIRHIIIGLKISYVLIRIRNQFDEPVFIFSGTLLIPTITSKLLKKTSILTAVASESNNFREIYKNSPKSSKYFYYYLTKALEQLTFTITDFISVESPNVARFLGLSYSSKKILGNGSLFIPDENFMQVSDFQKRPYLIGYIGRLSDEKGIGNFIHSLSRLFTKNKKICVLICGDGPLKSDISIYIKNEGLINRVNLAGWIAHDKLPDLLNQLRLLVIPSYSEGLPNIMLEAMACGTPVLATSVGAIPDIIKEGETGFIMENNTPECIADNITRALEDSNLEKIAMNAKKLVEKKFSFESSVLQWKKNLDEIKE